VQAKVQELGSEHEERPQESVKGGENGQEREEISELP